MGYKTEIMKSGALLVKDVPLMSVQKLTESHFKVKDIDRKWMERGLETFQRNKKIGKLPYLWDRHNTKENPAQVIGRLDNLRIEEMDGEVWYFADVIITDPMHQGKFLEGKSPSKSVEYQPDNYYLRGLALLDGHEGHFDADIPDFVPEGLYEELVALQLDASCTVLCHSSATTATGDTDMDMEALKAMLAENNKALLAEVDKKLSTVKPTAAGDIDAEIQRVREDATAQANVKLEKLKRDTAVTSYAEQLHAKTRTPVALLRKKLDSFETVREMQIYFEGAMKQAEADVKLSVEREIDGKVDLEAEYAEFKANYPNSTVTLSKYRELAEYKPRNYRDEGREVSTVIPRGNEFVTA